jgi:hypothetical protein
LTVSRQVRLGVLPLLEQMTGCYIYMSDNYFLYFSCKVPSLTRGRVCNLQCNDESSVSSYVATDSLSARLGAGPSLGQSESQITTKINRPVCPGVRRPFGTRDQFFFLLEIFFYTVAVCYFVVPSLTSGRDHKSKSHYDRQLVSQSVLVSGPIWDPRLIFLSP